MCNFKCSPLLPCDISQSRTNLGICLQRHDSQNTLYLKEARPAPQRGGPALLEQKTKNRQFYWKVSGNNRRSDGVFLKNTLFQRVEKGFARQQPREQWPRNNQSVLINNQCPVCSAPSARHTLINKQTRSQVSGLWGGNTFCTGTRPLPVPPPQPAGPCPAFPGPVGTSRVRA